MPFTETAYAKINLALHVRRRREDGHHEIETLFAFVDDGDLLSVEVAEQDSLTITGEFAEGLSTGPDNLVLRAVGLARELGAAVPPLAIALEKNLPVAAGLGGGSADAGAMLRLIVREWPSGLTLDAVAADSAVLGADVPACVLSQTMLGTGVGDLLRPISDSDVARLPVLLVNPNVPLLTGPVFKGWDGEDRGPLSGDPGRAQRPSGSSHGNLPRNR
jgi:4-diphosphocytidyl-2-C-methyl-D-erythritol kinase